MSGFILVASPITAFAMTDSLYLTLSKLPTNRKYEIIDQEQNRIEFVEQSVENTFGNYETTTYITLNRGEINNIDEIIKEGGKIEIAGYSVSKDPYVSISLVSTSKLPFSISACPSDGGSCKKLNPNSKYIISTSMSSFEENNYIFYIVNESSNKENHIEGNIFIVE